MWEKGSAVAGSFFYAGTDFDGTFLHEYKSDIRSSATVKKSCLSSDIMNSIRLLRRIIIKISILKLTNDGFRND